MGPRPRGRGIIFESTGWRQANWLQWGRARAGAESPPHQPTRLRSPSLQWGRARAGAESNLPYSPDDLFPFASMGPRPRGRGIAKIFVEIDKPRKLQWGRARA